MAPCDPNDLSINVPNGPAGPGIPGFGTPFAPPLPDFDSLLPDGFPEDLLQLLDDLQLILPPGIIKPALNPNFGKDVFDGIMKLLDQFFPFLMLYKFFLPILDLIICIIEVLCAIANPFKLIRKLKRLFRTCLPAFLSLFPVFALIVMLLSLLFLIIALIEYIIEKILEIIALLLANILGLIEAFQLADEVGILAIVKKLSEILCAFQNLFVLFAIFKTIIDIIKEILKLFFKIPPCDDGDNGDSDKCCTPEICPSFIKNNEEIVSSTGTLQYFNRVGRDANLTSVLPGLPAGFLVNNTRNESWQFYDPQAAIAFYSITAAPDLPAGFNTVFFPTDANYTATTPSDQVPYTVDLRLFYDTTKWNGPNIGASRFVRVNNCIVLQAPTQNLVNYDNSTSNIPSGVFNIQGGQVFEDDGITPISNLSLNTLFHMTDEISTSPITLLPTDGQTLTNVQYTWHIQHEVLLSKGLITLGCIPSVGLDRTFTNTVFGGNAGANFSILNDIVNGLNGHTFPDIGAAQEGLAAALTALRGNISVEGVNTFQATTNAVLNKLQNDTLSAIHDLVGVGFDQYKSTFTISPSIQFTTQPISVQVALNESNGQSLTTGMPASAAAALSGQIVPLPTFGQVDNFVYDGAKFFNANLTSDTAGSGTIRMSFDGKIFSQVITPTDITQSPSIEELVIPYAFVFSPKPGALEGSTVGTGDTDGKPRYDETDVSGDSNTG